MAANATLSEALCAMESGSLDILLVYISLRDDFMQKKNLSSYEVADKGLS